MLIQCKILLQREVSYSRQHCKRGQLRSCDIIDIKDTTLNMELYRSSFFFSAMDILGEHSFVVLLFCSTFSRNGVCFIYGHLLFYRGVIQKVNYQVQILLDNVILTCEHVLWT